MKLQRSIVKHCDGIRAAIEHQLSNGLVESTNTKIHPAAHPNRIQVPFRRILIALAMRTLGGYRPAPPSRK